MGNGSKIPNSKKPCSEFTPPEWEFPAHVAALGMRFWNGKIVVAEHGSWNRSTPQGYQVVMLELQNDKIVKSTPLVTGWLKGSKHWGRPVDVQVYFDGSLLISDDEAGVIYQVRAKNSLRN